MTKEEAILISIISECKKHLSRINYAYRKLMPLLPFTPDKVAVLQDEEVEHLDHYIFRFSKLQDAIGQKLFKSVLVVLGEEVYNKPFLDIFNRLEQLAIISDYERWNLLREIRNEISHDYDEDPAELAEKLNKIVDSKTILEAYLNDVLAYLKKAGLQR